MLKFALKLIELLLGTKISDKNPRADMYLPARTLAMSAVFMIAGIGVGVYAAMTLSIKAAVIAALGIILGVCAFLCWRNQKIVMVSESWFEYTTFLGKTTTYRFEEITAYRRNRDSTTLFVGKNKIHIEANAIMTKRLSDRLDALLAPPADGVGRADCE